MKLSKFAKFYESMYTDRLRVYRHQEVINDDGTTGISDKPVLIAGVSCRISFNSKDSSAALREELNPENLQLQVFCKPEVDVIKGDFIEVDRVGDDGTVLKSYEGIASLPSQYVTHKEFLIMEVGEA